MAGSRAFFVRSIDIGDDICRVNVKRLCFAFGVSSKYVKSNPITINRHYLDMVVRFPRAVMGVANRHNSPAVYRIAVSMGVCVRVCVTGIVLVFGTVFRLNLRFSVKR